MHEASFMGGFEAERGLADEPIPDARNVDEVGPVGGAEAGQRFLERGGAAVDVEDFPGGGDIGVSQGDGAAEAGAELVGASGLVALTFGQVPQQRLAKP